MKKKYKDLLTEYPECITKEQLYKICHISKETAKCYLDNGFIPCANNGKKPRCYTIATEDVIAFLEDKDANPEKYRLPRSAWSRVRQPILPAKPEEHRGSLLGFYREHYADYPDVLTVDEAAEMVKVTRDTVLKWCAEKKFAIFTVKRAFRIPKDGYLKWLVILGKQYTKAATLADGQEPLFQNK